VIGIAGRTEGAGPRLYARLPLFPSVVPGDRITVSGRVRPPPDDGFGEYLRRAGIAGTLTATELERLPSGSAPLAWLEERRRTAGDLIGRVLPEPEAGLASGMVLGLRELVDRTLAADFTTSGLSHIVAISGWNIAIVAATVGALLRRLPRRWRSAAVVGVIAAYAVAAGGGASVVRAAVMASAVVAARESGRGARAGAALGLAAAAMLIADPMVSRDPGFQLSAAATAGILTWARPLTAALRARLPTRIPDVFVETLGLSLAAQAVTLPIVLADFGRLSLVAPAANLVAAPLILPAMVASAAALVVGWVVSLPGPAWLDGMTVAAAGAAGTVCWGALRALAGVVQVSAAVPFASLELPEPLNLAAAAGACVVARMAWLRLRPRPAQAWAGTPQRPPAQRPEAARGGASTRVRRLAIMGGAAAVAVILVASGQPDGRLRVTFLDVGQGDAILVEGPRGGRMLIDGGPDPARLIAQLDARIPPWSRSVDIAVVTHPHDDHLAGFPMLLRRYAVRDFRGPPLEGGDDAFLALEAEIPRAGLVARTLGAGDTISLGGASVLALWPRRTVGAGTGSDIGRVSANDEVNDTSMVLEIRYGGRRVLLTGDITEKVDAGILDGEAEPTGAQEAAPPPATGSAASALSPVDVLKVAHHGSRTSTSPAFLASARPLIAVISVGADNRYGHPDEQTLTRLLDAGVRVLRTDLVGWISVSTDGRDLRVETARGGRWDLAPNGVSQVALPHRIASWQFPPGPPPRRSSSRSIRRTGSSPTSAPWRRSRRSSRSGRTPGVCRWTAALSRPPPSCTTSTSSSPATIRFTNSGTARAPRGG
jgi:competence protein ComEC